jgi:prephenate dehydratase
MTSERHGAHEGEEVHTATKAELATGVTGVFEAPHGANQAFEVLLKLGYHPDEIGILIAEETKRRWKTSIVFRIANEPGSLFRALGAFALFNIDLSKIESRPIEGRPWEYAFYLDVIGRNDEANVARAIDNLQQLAEDVRVLGSYATRW